MSKLFDFAVLIGRFQPYHIIHHQLAQLGLSRARNLLMILGSSHQARSPKNPFSWQEREEMIRRCFTPQESRRLHFIPLEDAYDLGRWVADLKRHVSEVVGQSTCCLVGYHKDVETADYLDELAWEYVSTDEPTQPVNATLIRDQYFNSLATDHVKGEVSWEQFLLEPVIIWLKDFLSRPDYSWLQKEWQFYRDYQKHQDPAKYLLDRLKEAGSGWSNDRKSEGEKWIELAETIYHSFPKYPVQFLTADCVILHQGKILLGTRKDSPGLGLWALPGGHVSPNETFLQGAVREAEEETGIASAVKVSFGRDLTHFLMASQNFDHPHRSLKGRTFTQAFLFQLPENKVLSNVRGSDDLKNTFWLPISDLTCHKSQFFEDHFHIISRLVKSVSS